MALIKCPNCNNEVSDTIDTCIHCGYNLRNNTDTNQNIFQNYNKKFNIKKLLLLILLIIVVGYFIFNLIFRTKEQESEKYSFVNIGNSSWISSQKNGAVTAYQFKDNENCEWFLSMNSGATFISVGTCTYTTTSDTITMHYPNSKKTYTYSYKFYKEKYTGDKSNPYYGKTFVYVYLDDERYMNTMPLEGKDDLESNNFNIQEIKPAKLNKDEVEYIYEVKNANKLPSNLKPNSYVDIYFSGFEDDLILSGNLINNVRILDVRDENNNTIDTSINKEIPTVIKLAVPKDMYYLLHNITRLSEINDIELTLINVQTSTDENTQIASEGLYNYILSKSIFIND